MVSARNPFSKIDYCQYLISSQINYTITNLAEHLQRVSHDVINRYLKDEKITPNMVWEHVKSDIVQSQNGYIVFDDTVVDKRHSRHIENARWQYSGNEHGVIQGIGVVTCIYVNPELDKFWAIDYRIFDPDRDGKSKMDHVKEMLCNIVYYKDLEFTTVLMDTWYSSNSMMLDIDSLEKLFFCPIKSNRLIKEVEDPKEKYRQAEKLEWSEQELARGKIIKIKNFPGAKFVKLFRIAVSTNRTDFVVTNDMSQDSSNSVQKVCKIRWNVERFHRELKQNTGVEECQCRKQRIQRNHIGCSILVWIVLTRIARSLGKTIYQLKQGLLKDYLIYELKSPSIRMAVA